MILSPPFLPAPKADETDDEYVARSMVADPTGEGTFPVGSDMTWHTGLHLVAPGIAGAGAGAAPPVRAIADGTVAFVRRPTGRATGPDHPLNYGRGWTDDGCVVIRHETDIGGRSSDPVAVTFFSLYMHLEDVAPSVRARSAIFRKDAVGRAGSIYGRTNRLHFAVFCDDANVARLVGRTTAELDVSEDGRDDVLFGTTYFLVPARTPILPSDPRDPAFRGTATPAPSRFVVSVRYARGDAVVRTLHEDGTLVGSLTEAGAEYRLVATAQRRFPASPSAGVELLRLGRVVGKDALDPANVPNWRPVVTPGGGVGYVDLNDPGVRRYSDGDFPHWMDWVCVDASASPDSRCLDATVRRTLGLDVYGRIRQEDATRALADSDARRRLSHAICKLRTEWDDAEIDERFDWLRLEPSIRLTPSRYKAFRDHVAALAFWRQADLGIDARCWHFHPRAFVSHFRQCGWLSANELAQCIPPALAWLRGSAFETVPVMTYNAARKRGEAWCPYVNVAMRKYGIGASKPRIVHFLAQSMEESQYLTSVVERRGDEAPYAPFYGRGLVQLTFLGNYVSYGKFRGFPRSADVPAPFRELGWDPEQLIARSDTDYDAAACADVAGFYWTTHDVAGANGLALSDKGLGVGDVIAVSRFVNGALDVWKLNGLDVRLGLAVYMKYALLDDLRPDGPAPLSEPLTFTWRRSSAGPASPAQHVVRFPLRPQRP